MTTRLPPHTWKLLATIGLLFLLPLAAFVSLAEDVEEDGILSFDRPVMMWLHSLTNPALTVFMKAITELGGVVAVPILAVLAGLIAWRKGQRTPAAILVATVGGASLMNSALKVFFARQRPDFWAHLVVENSYSFPSGHAMASMALAAACVLLTWNTRHRWWVLAVSTLYVVLIGVSRMYLGVHYPSDILAGWCVALAWATIVDAVLRRRWKKSPLESQTLSQE